MSHGPQRNDAAVLTEPGKIAVEQRRVPEPGPGQVLIRVASVGVCGSDVHYFEHGRIGDFVVEEPLVLGHEASGTIVGVGLGVAPDRLGERVAIEPQTTCGQCKQCRRGRYNLCRTVRFYATPPIDGAFMNYVVAESTRSYAVPEGLGDDEAALIEPLSVAVWANEKADVRPGDTVLITGAGPIGLLCMQVAEARGASRTILMDINPERLKTAKNLGCTQTIDLREERVNEDLEADVLFECTGAQPAVDSALRALAPAARVIFVGMADQVTLPLGLIQSREISFTGTFRYANVYPAAIDLAARGKVDLRSLVTSHWGLAEVSDALTASKRSPQALKAMVHP